MNKRNKEIKRIPVRSDKYQYLLLEVCMDHDSMGLFSNDRSLSGLLNPFGYNENVLQLEDELRAEFYRIVNTMLTPNQKWIMLLYIDGYTQMEIAKILDVNQSSVVKSLKGNVDYRGGKKVYGGSIHKIKKIVAKDEKIQQILKELSEMREEIW